MLEHFSHPQILGHCGLSLRMYQKKKPKCFCLVFKLFNQFQILKEKCGLLGKIKIEGKES